MSKYLPPSLRKDTPTIQTNNFPALGGNSLAPRTIQSNDGSYADKAESWRQQRLANEHKKQVEKELEAYRNAKREERKLEDEAIANSSPFKQRAVKHVVEAVKETVVTDTNDGWQVVEKKKRKERIDKVDYTEVPEDISSNSEDDEQYDNEFDKDTLWK